MKRLVLFLSLAAPLLLSAAQTRRQVVDEFCHLDLSGARLHSTEDAPIWRLTLDDGEPPDGPVVIARSYRVAQAGGPESTAVVVRYEVLGLVDDNMVFTPGATRFATGNFHLISKDGWKISLKSLKVPPHVTPDAYANHIDLLIQAMNRKPPEERDQARLASLQKLKAQILALK